MTKSPKVGAVGVLARAAGARTARGSYVAGRLAQTYGALPAEFKCRRAARVAYDLHLSSLQPKSMLERLQRLSRRADVVRIKGSKLPKMSDREFHRVPAFIQRKKGGQLELMLTRAALKRLSPTPMALLRNPDVKEILVRDGKHMAVKRRLRAGGKKERVYCFLLLRPAD